MPPATRSAWRWIGRRSNIVRPPVPNFPRSKWRTTPNACATAWSSCSAAIPARTRPPASTGACSPRSGTMPPIACPKSPTMPPAWTAPCAPASTGKWARSNSGTPPACGATVERMKAAGEPVSRRGGTDARSRRELVRRLRCRDLQPRQRHVPDDPRSRRHRAHRRLPRLPRRGAAEPRRLAHRYRRWRRLPRTPLGQDGHRRGHGRVWSPRRSAPMATPCATSPPS